METADFTYYADGLRKTKDGELYIYDGKNVLAEIDNMYIRLNVYGNTLLFTIQGTITTENEVTFVDGKIAYAYEFNLHGDVVKVLGIAGIVLNTYTYDAFGVITQQSETVGNTFYYAGYQYDSETGLYYLRSRYYNAETARFITEDSFNGYYNDPLSLNRYTYCHNSPIIYFDPDGQAAYNTRMTDTGYSLDSRAMANEIRQEIDKNEDNSFEFPDQLFGLTETTITNISPLHVNDDLIAGGYKVTVGTIDTRGDEGWININTTNIFYTDGTFKTICTLSLGIIDLSVNGGTDGVGISIGGKIDFKEDISYSGHVGLQIDNVGLFLEGAGSSAVRHTYTESTARIGISKEGLKMILAVLAASQCIPAPDPFPTPVPPPFPVPPPIPAPAY